MNAEHPLFEGAAPEPLRQLIARDLQAVRPLPPPWKRSLALAPFALAPLVWVVVRFGVRADARAMGALLWTTSLVEFAFGVLLFVAVLHAAVPGRDVRLGASLVAGLGLLLFVVFLTWQIHPTFLPAGQWVHYTSVCFRYPMVIGLPLLLVTLLLALRAFPLQPALLGAVAGFGAGLVSESGWRLFCEVTDPLHLASSHVPAILVLVALGAVVGSTGMKTRR